MGDSALTLVAGETGGLSYRGFDVARARPGARVRVGVLHLLLHGDPRRPLPKKSALRGELTDARALSPRLEEVADALPSALPPLEALRTLLSAMGTRTFGYPPTLEQGLDLVAKAPILLARFDRRVRGLPPLAARSDLGHVANYLYLLNGREPDPARVRALQTYFILLADHGMNASTFALRVVVSTNADLISGATAAHRRPERPASRRRARRRSSDMLDAVAAPGDAEAWITAALGRKERLMGFGHRAYKTEDPRAVLLHREARTSASPERLRLAETVETAALAALRRAQARPAALHERRVLWRDRPRVGRARPRAVHADLRAGADRRMGRARPRAGRRQPAASGRTCATSARPSGDGGRGPGAM